MAYFVRAFLIVTTALAATFLPFIAGGYDPLARPLSSIAWMLGRVGLLLVPIGGLWLWTSAKHVSGTRPPGWLVWLTFGTWILIALVMILIAFVSGILLVAGTTAFAGFLSIRLFRRLQAKQSGPPIPRAVAAILVVVPIVVLAAQSALDGPITSYGRNRVIRNSAPLIAEIERYRARHGVYPVSLFSLYGDYKPSIVGVQRYHYEASGESYNVIFEEPSLEFGTRRFVVYNPRDEQRVTVHESDRLLLDGPQLDADNAGYTVVQPLPQPHWKIFLFLS